MSSASVILLTTGVPGAGKTYVRASRFLVDDYLVNTKGIHISNFPLNVEKISEVVSKRLSRGSFFSFKKKKVSFEDIKKRIEIIPDWVLQSWRNEVSGPWEYFQGRDLRYCHIAIDEIQNYVSPSKSKEYLQKWDEFLGEIRHRGCTFEGLTQDIDQVDKIFTGRAAVRLEIVPCEVLRDPYFKIPMLDWYELKAGFTGSFHKTVFEVEKRKTDKGWKVNHTRRFLIVPEYFVYYNSFSASLQEKDSGTVDDDRTPLYEYQQRSKLGILLWFIRRNFFSLFIRFVLVILFCWLFFFGGFSTMINLFVENLVSSARKGQGVTEEVQPGQSPSEVPGEVQPGQSPSELPVDKFNTFSEFKIVFFTQDLVYLKNGIILELNEKIENPGGLFHGLEVVTINLLRRFVVLSDHTILRM